MRCRGHQCCTRYRAGKKHGIGRGKFTDSDGTVIYDEDVYKGEFHGRGKQTSTDGDVYEGERKRG